MRCWTGAISVLTLAIGFVLGAVAVTLWDAGASAGPEATALATFREAFAVTRDRYVEQDQTDPTEMVHEAIDGMIEGLQDTGHSRFLTPEQRRRERQGLEGTYVGIGVEMAERDGRPVVVAPFPGSPAARAGLRPGDRVLRVDGEDVANLSLSELGARLRGPEGSEVRVTVLHPDNTVMEVTLRREEIRIPFVTWAPLRDSSLWHIYISRFGEGTARDLDRALAAARQGGATGIVLDLRDNPGGLLDEAVGVVRRFVEDGVVLLERDRDGNTTRIEVKEDVPAVSLPVVVLINGGSASAAEIVAAALLYHGRAVAVGVETFGTGTVLQTFPLPDGSALLLGVREWLTPAGEPLRSRGITPTHVVPLAPEVTPVVPHRPSAPPEHVCTSEDAQLRAGAGRLGIKCNAA